MKNLLKPIVFLVTIVSLGTICSCSEDEQEYDPYTNWQVRNTEWFRSVADSARTAIAQAKAQYGDKWEDYCEWRMYKRLDQVQDYNTGRLDDSICVRIAVPNPAPGNYSPTWSDSVRISHRGWLIPATYKRYNSDNVLVDSIMQLVFDQSYYGEFNVQTVAPTLWATSGFVTGFGTALQYMVEGDDWFVYVPARLAYGETANNEIPANSTLIWRIHLAAVYPCNSGVPDWKVKRQIRD